MHPAVLPEAGTNSSPPCSSRSRRAARITRDGHRCADGRRNVTAIRVCLERLLLPRKYRTVEVVLLPQTVGQASSSEMEPLSSAIGGRADHCG